MTEVPVGRILAIIREEGKPPMLDRLRGEADPIALLTSVPGIGKSLAKHLHEDLEIDTLEELEIAAHDGRLSQISGIGEKRLAGIIDSLAGRLGRVRERFGGKAAGASAQEPPVAELLDVDREYREKASGGLLHAIAPRRFNPTGEAWLPVLHTERGPRHYTALFSNAARAHQLKRKSREWVILYYDEDGSGERQCIIVAATRGAVAGQRIVRGRESECAAYYHAHALRESAMMGG